MMWASWTASVLRAMLAALIFSMAPGLLPSPIAAQGASSPQMADPLPSWNEGAAKNAILDFVRATTTPSSAGLVPPQERIATFDQDGTLWVEHPVYTQALYAFARLHVPAEARPELKQLEPFKTVLSGDRDAIAKLPLHELEKVLAATLTGMTVEAFQEQAEKWLETARDARWKRPYTELTYLPMQEVLAYLRANGFRTYIATGGGQDFVLVYAEAVYGIPPERIWRPAGSIPSRSSTGRRLSAA